MTRALEILRSIPARDMTLGFFAAAAFSIVAAAASVVLP